LRGLDTTCQYVNIKIEGINVGSQQYKLKGEKIMIKKEKDAREYIKKNKIVVYKILNNFMTKVVICTYGKKVVDIIMGDSSQALLELKKDGYKIIEA